MPVRSRPCRVTQSRVEWIRRVQGAMTKEDQTAVDDMRNIAARLEAALAEFQGKLAAAKAQSPAAPVPKLLDEVKILAASLCVLLFSWTWSLAVAAHSPPTYWPYAMALPSRRSCIGDLQARQCQIDYLSELAYIALRSANVAQRNLPDRERLIAAFEIATELLAKLAEACSLVSGLTTNDAGTAERLNQCFHDLDSLNEQWANRINT